MGLVVIKVRFLDSHGNLNIQNNKFLKLPIYLDIEFEEKGKFNVVIMMPNGFGAAYYSGRTQIGKTVRYGTPIRSLNGLWKAIIVVLEPGDVEPIYETLEAYLDSKIPHISIDTDLKIIQENYPESEVSSQVKTTFESPTGEILWKIIYPTLDIITLYPILWVKGIGPNNGEIYINNDKRIIKISNENSFFWEPILLQKGSQHLYLESRIESNEFRHEVNIYYLETANRVLDIFNETLRRSIVITGTYQQHGNQTKLDSDYKFGKKLKWVYPQNETTILTKIVRIYGEVDKLVDILTLNDSQEIPLTITPTAKKFDLNLPVKIGTTELVLRTIINDEVAEVASRNINVQFSPTTLPSLQIIRPQQNFVITDSNFPIIIEGFTTPSSEVLVNDQKINSDNEGHFKKEML